MSFSNIFQIEFARTLGKSDSVIIAANPLKTTVSESENLNTALLVEHLKSDGHYAAEAKDLTVLQAEIDKAVEDHDILLILSNRTCLGLWESQFVKDLK